MLTLILTITFFTVLIAALLAFIPNDFFKKSYFLGIVFWSKALPILGIAVIFVILMVNLFGISNQHMLSLSPVLNIIEISILLCVLPFFIGKNACLFSYIAFLYLLVKFLFVSQVPSVGNILLISSFITVGILADKLPWIKQTRFSQVKSLREILVSFMCIGLLGIVIYTIFHLNSFINWMGHIYYLHLSYAVWASLVACILGGWIFTILGYGRRYILPILSYPSLIFVAYVTNWPSYFLIIPFTMLVTLALAETDRRAIIRE